jgi:hypothetical protein
MSRSCNIHKTFLCILVTQFSEQKVTLLYKFFFVANVSFVNVTAHFWECVKKFSTLWDNSSKELPSREKVFPLKEPTLSLRPREESLNHSFPSITYLSGVKTFDTCTKSPVLPFIEGISALFSHSKKVRKGNKFVSSFYSHVNTILRKNSGKKLLIFYRLNS